MPQMSGFEFLSVVRRRFPEVLVIVMSGAYGAGDAVPGAVIADAFYTKGHNKLEILLKLIADAFRTSVSQLIAHSRESAPVWIPRRSEERRVGKECRSRWSPY